MLWPFPCLPLKYCYNCPPYGAAAAVPPPLMHAGSLKGVLDPFKDLSPEELATVRELLEELHTAFKQASVMWWGGVGFAPTLHSPADQLR